MRFDRRQLLALLGTTAAAPAVGQPPPGRGLFIHGVASGDPQPDRVIIWTRLTAQDASAQLVAWEVALDPGFADIVAHGSATAGPDRDFTVKADVAGLTPGTEYYYRFRAVGALSPTGRTRTLASGRTDQVILAVASCSNYQAGFFNAYQAIADEPRLDAVLHLGDYIYEYGGPGSYGADSVAGPERPHDPPREILSLADYRLRHAQYKADPQLQAAHARAPWIVVWDDHETANDSWVDGAQNHQPGEGDWATRKAAALRAYYEWMPIREPAAGQGMAEAAMRSFHFGDLAALVMVETRLTGRTQQLTYARDLGPSPSAEAVATFRDRLADPSRRMMDARQEAWIETELQRSVAAGHAWQVLGNQVVMARMTAADPKTVLGEAVYAAATPEARAAYDEMAGLAALGLSAALDSWDGYPADRERLYGRIAAAGARTIVVSGDSHAFWANTLHDAQGRRIACEFGTSGISSIGAGELAPGVNAGELMTRGSRDVAFCDEVARGYVRLTLTRAEARGDMVTVSTVDRRDFTARVLKSFRTTPDGAGLTDMAEV
jgi:alkaline phosphatase D